MPNARTAFPSAARTATPTPADISQTGPAAVVVIDVTAVGTAPSITVSIDGVDPVSGKTYSILSSAAITAVGTTRLRVHPSLPAAANDTAQDALPADWRISPTHANADSITYSIAVLPI